MPWGINGRYCFLIGRNVEAAPDRIDDAGTAERMLPAYLGALG